MDVRYLYLHKRTPKKIRLVLIFSGFMAFLQSCDQRGVEQINLQYEGLAPASVSFQSDFSPDALRVYLQGEAATPVMGKIGSEPYGYRFRPVIPFTGGQTYEIRKGTRILGSFYVPFRDMPAPKLLALYPTTDTVPENLLKIYLRFSRPMQAFGNPLDFIRVSEEQTGDTVDVFLQLDPPLWDRERMRLTLWLDPGRIKTGLIPNRELGLPLQSGHSYRLHVSERWKSAEGVSLSGAMDKHLVAVSRDANRPDIKAWKVQPPAMETRDTLRIAFGEPMDGVLVLECLTVEDDEGIGVPGLFGLGPQERSVWFIPEIIWKKGIYTIIIQSKLEDLAGNNLNRLFDNDLKLAPAGGKAPDHRQLGFRVR